MLRPSRDPPYYVGMQAFGDEGMKAFSAALASGRTGVTRAPF